MTSEQLDLFPSEGSSPLGGLVRISPWRAVVRAWREHAQGCGGRSDDQLVAVNVRGSEQFSHFAPLGRCVIANAKAQISRHKEAVT